MPRHQADSVFQRRAIFIDARALNDIDEKAIENLRWLGRLYRIVACGGATLHHERKRLVHEILPGPDAAPRVRALSIEAYASWFIGEAPPIGMRKVYPCRVTGDTAKALRAIRRLETESRVIIDLDLLRDRVALMRRRGERIVFTNGVFDLLHIGHLRLLESARRFGDRLIVAVNSDDSARRLKGSPRPVVPQFARAELLSRLRQVDCCCIFTGKDPGQVLSIVRPDVLAKGSDYTLARIVGARFVKGYGGTVVRLPLVEGWSTTSTIKGFSRRDELGQR
jgi:D-glycero-beta-D-manno-heptose 1-phosphate adenylyltransferase